LEIGMDDLGGKKVLQAKEPIFNAPWPALVLLGGLGLAFALQKTLLTEPGLERLALSPPGLRGGAYETLISYMFLHSGWAHFGMNAISALAFGPPVARFLGERGRGPALFFGFFLVCGVVAGLGYCLVHWNGAQVVIGASGAISGLWGAASRLLIGRGALASPLDRQVITQGVAFAGINVVVGMVGIFGALNVAWEAHLIGYLAGLLLIGPFARLAGVRV
jgi:membrane associated rhomboid family serine protease